MEHTTPSDSPELTQDAIDTPVLKTPRQKESGGVLNYMKGLSQKVVLGISLAVGGAGVGMMDYNTSNVAAAGETTENKESAETWTQIPSKEVKTRAGIVIVIDRTQGKDFASIEGEEADKCSEQGVILIGAKKKVTIEKAGKSSQHFLIGLDIGNQLVLSANPDIETADGKPVQMIPGSGKIFRDRNGNLACDFEFYAPKGDLFIGCDPMLQVNKATDEARLKSAERLSKIKEVKEVLDVSEKVVPKHVGKENPCYLIQREVKKTLPHLRLLDVSTIKQVAVSEAGKYPGHAAFILVTKQGLVFIDPSDCSAGFLDHENVPVTRFLSTENSTGKYAGGEKDGPLVYDMSNFDAETVKGARSDEAKKNAARLNDRLNNKLLPDIRAAAKGDSNLLKIVGPMVTARK